MPEKPPEVAVGEEWAYREKAGDAVTLVRVTRIGTTRPLRVRIRFMDDAYEGREDWVPPARLKVRWADVAHWQEREDRRKAVRDVSQHMDDTPESWAAEFVFDALSDVEVSQGLGCDAGVMEIRDVDKLCAALGFDKTRLVNNTLSFVGDDGFLVTPWAVTLEVARHAAPLVADRILADVERSETKHRRRALHGDRSKGFDGEEHYMSPEVCLEIDEKWQERYDLVRQWCGASAVDRHDELVALRDEVLRLGQIADRAIRVLGEVGATEPADELRRELGIPVETLRASVGYGHRRDPSSGP
jgi:hypothetical protein